MRINFKDRVLGENGVFKKINMCESSYIDTYRTNASEIGCYTADNQDTIDMTKTFFAAVASYLSNKKVAKDDEVVVFNITDETGEFKFAAAVEYNTNKNNPSEAGSWKYSQTFVETDYKEEFENRKVITYNYDTAFKAVLDKVAIEFYGLSYHNDTIAYNSVIIAINSLLNVLDASAIEGEDVEIELPGFFIATVSVNSSGEKEFSIIPGEAMKEIVKNDNMLSAIADL